MLRSSIRRNSVQARQTFELPPDIFLADPENAVRLNANLHIWNRFQQEVLIFLALAVLAVLVFWVSVQLIRPLLLKCLIQQSGISTTGIVQGKYTTPSGGYQQDVHYLQYLFSDSSGGNYTSEQPVSQSAYNQYENGASIPVKYFSFNPSQSALNCEDSLLSVENIVTALISTLVFGAVAILTGYEGRRIWCENRFFTRGSLLKGHVLICRSHLETVSEALGGQPRTDETPDVYIIDLAYTFHSPSGKTIKSSLKQERFDLLHVPLPRFGTPIAVLYLDDQHHRIL